MLGWGAKGLIVREVFFQLNFFYRGNEPNGEQQQEDQEEQQLA